MSWKERVEGELERKRREEALDKAAYQARVAVAEQSEREMEAFRHAAFTIPDRLGVVSMLEDIRRDVWRGSGQVAPYSSSPGPGFRHGDSSITSKGWELVYCYRRPDIQTCMVTKKKFGFYAEWVSGSSGSTNPSGNVFPPYKAGRRLGWHDEEVGTKGVLVWTDERVETRVCVEELSPGLLQDHRDYPRKPLWIYQAGRDYRRPAYWQFRLVVGGSYYPHAFLGLKPENINNDALLREFIVDQLTRRFVDLVNHKVVPGLIEETMRNRSSELQRELR